MASTERDDYEIGGAIVEIGTGLIGTVVSIFNPPAGKVVSEAGKTLGMGVREIGKGRKDREPGDVPSNDAPVPPPVKSESDKSTERVRQRRRDVTRLEPEERTVPVPFDDDIANPDDIYEGEDDDGRVRVSVGPGAMPGMPDEEETGSDEEETAPDDSEPEDPTPPADEAARDEGTGEAPSDPEDPEDLASTQASGTGEGERSEPVSGFRRLFGGGAV